MINPTLILTPGEDRIQRYTSPSRPLEYLTHPNTNLNHTPHNTHDHQPPNSNKTPPAHTQPCSFTLDSTDRPIFNPTSQDLSEPDPPNKTDSHFRIYFQNINGIRIDRNGGNWPMICQTAQTLQTDMISLCEINIDTKKYHIREQIHASTRKYFQHYRLQTAHTNTRSATNYKPGGIAQLTLSHIGVKMGETRNDRLGRWCSTEFRGSNNQRLIIYSLYQPGTATPQPGRFTIINQQHAEIALESMDEFYESPRKTFQKDIQTEVTQKLQLGYEILLVGDWNESLTDRTAWIKQFMDVNGLIDIIHNKSTIPTTTTYKRGTRRIDIALGTPRILDCCTAAQYIPFDYYLLSDHKAIVLDLDILRLIGTPNSSLVSPQQREFDTRNPASVSKYLLTKDKELQHHNFAQRLYRLEQDDNITPNDIEKFDKDIVRASQHAAKKCMTRQREPWNPKLAKAWARMMILQSMISALRNKQVAPKALSPLQRKYNLSIESPQSITEAEEQFKLARKLLQDERREAAAKRREFLMERAQFYETAKDPSGEKALRRMVAAEETKRLYKKFAAARGKTKSIGLTSLKIPKDHQDPTLATEWETINDLPTIEEKLMRRNQLHFGQAHGTPFTVDSLVKIIGDDATGIATEEILAGTFTTDTISTATALMIEYMKAATSRDISNETITKKEFQDKLKHWPEKTTTSPSGLHLSHYQALIRSHDIDSESNDYPIIENARDSFIRAHLAIMNTCIKLRHPLHRWCNAVNIMLEKEQGNPRIHRLRVIHIFEADYNMILGIKWRQALHLAEDEKVLFDGMYGSRPGRSATEPKLVEVLQNEIYRASFKKGINMDLDASSCYDRIIPNVAAICSRKHGITQNLATLHTRVLLSTKYRLQTAQGVSVGTYSHSSTSPVYGIGQGAQNSPTIWNFVSSTLCHALQDTTQGAIFESWDKNISLRLNMIGFVDDKSQRTNCFTRDIQPSDEELTLLMESDAHTWSELLWTSGGKLETTKCSFYMMKPTLSPSSEPFLDVTLCPTIKIPDPTTGSYTEIRQLSPYESHKTLGAYINGAGRMQTQLKALQQKCLAHVQALQRIPTTKAETWRYYFAIFLPSITYTLPVTSFTEKECDSIQSTIMKTFVGRCGFRRTMSLAIRYGPPKLGGAGFRPLFQEQGVLAIELLICHLRSNNQLSGLIRITLSWWQAYCGVSWPILQYPDRPLPHMQHGWIDNIRKFLARIQGQLEISDIDLDSTSPYIMDCVDPTLFSPQEMRQINHCRLYLQIWKIHDIDRRCCAFSPPEFPTHDSSYHRFNIPQPHMQAWKTWRKFVYSDSLEHRLALNERWFPAPPLDILTQTIATYTHRDIEELLHTQTSLLVSDGSVIGKIMTFGWVLATTTGTILAKGRGFGRGGAPTSFRAEGFGTLSGLKWLKKQSDPTRYSTLQLTHIYTDNQGLITTLQKLRRRTWDPPRATLAPDWDIMSDIVTELKTVSPTSQVAWVEGHQDRRSATDRLSLPARLNILADHLAADQHEYSQPDIHSSTRLASNPIQLTIKGRAITSHYAQALRHAYGSGPLEQYAKRKFGWTDEVYDSIDWPEFQQFTKHFYKNRGTMIKHYWRLVPTGTIAFQNDPSCPPGCPECSCDEECNDHLMRCPSVARQTWRTQLYTKISQLNDQRPTADPLASRVLIAGLKSWLEGVPSDLTEYPDIYRRIYESQSQIGWDHLLRGRFSLRWRSITPISEKQTWTHTMGLLVLSHWLDLWKTRNAKLHGPDERTRQEIRKQKVMDQLHTLYRYKTKVTIRDRSLFYPTITMHLRRHPHVSAIENWIATHSQLITRSALRAKHNGDNLQTAITDFFCD